MPRTPSKVGIAIAAALLSMACDSLPDHVMENARKRRVRDLGIEFDGGGNAPKAGISVFREITVESLDPRPLGADTASPAYHLLLHRCGACHVAPDPGQVEADRWEAVVTRMEALIEDTGILPLAPGDRDAILSFLVRHAKDR